MSPVFAHGQLRLYLLALLDEGPCHGYEVIQRLQARFGGLYSPSAGTVYPRLGKLEEEGLVERTDEGRKATYRITDAGRAEVQARAGEIAELHAELDQSVRRLADEVRSRVHGRSAGLRAEIKAAARAARSGAQPPTPSAARRPDDPQDPVRPQENASQWPAWQQAWQPPAGSSGTAEATDRRGGRERGWGRGFGWGSGEVDWAMEEVARQARLAWQQHRPTAAQSAAIAEIVADAGRRIAEVLREPAHHDQATPAPWDPPATRDTAAAGDASSHREAPAPPDLP